MIANEEANLQEKFNQKAEQECIDKGKGRGYVPKLKKQRHYILR